MSEVQTSNTEQPTVSLRIQRLREALKKKPRGEEWKRKISEANKRAWAAGKMNTSPEAKAARLAGLVKALKGKKRDPETVEKVRQANLGKKRTPEMIENLRVIMNKLRSEGKYKCRDLKARNKKVSEALKGKRKGIPNPKQAAKMTGYKWDAAVVESRAAPMRGRAQKALATAKGPQHKNGVICEIRSPTNVVWYVRNITDFVRTHPHLFDPEDVVWVNYKAHLGREAWRCRAQKGIMKLREAKDPRGSWKGWTLVSDVEVYKNKGKDLLDRQWTPDPANAVQPCTESPEAAPTSDA